MRKLLPQAEKYLTILSCRCAPQSPGSEVERITEDKSKALSYDRNQFDMCHCHTQNDLRKQQLDNSQYSLRGQAKLLTL